MGRLINEKGNRFGRLVVIERTRNNKNKPVWLCLCDCGKYTKVTGSSLRQGKVKSCGCMLEET